MTINLQVGGVYADTEQLDHRITHLSARGLFVSDRGYTFCANGQKYASVKSHYDLIRVISEPDAPTDAPSDPLAHLFEEVPAMRKFIGGKVYRSTRIYTDVGLVSISNENGLSIYSSPSEARILAAALIAAADAIDREAE
jgi:hypothetical protein